ncbi:hypothetical protein DFJ74DRAFT_657121 [Hyaloraphidium curvatum]|nr:hypothetical protein DFJ74DRAFT_657121 [Hyaloraphidium curvatum]
MRWSPRRRPAWRSLPPEVFARVADRLSLADLCFLIPFAAGRCQQGTFQTFHRFVTTPIRDSDFRTGRENRVASFGFDLDEVREFLSSFLQDRDASADLALDFVRHLDRFSWDEMVVEWLRREHKEIVALLSDPRDHTLAPSQRLLRLLDGLKVARPRWSSAFIAKRGAE